MELISVAASYPPTTVYVTDWKTDTVTDTATLAFAHPLEPWTTASVTNATDLNSATLLGSTNSSSICGTGCSTIPSTPSISNATFASNTTSPVPTTIGHDNTPITIPLLSSTQPKPVPTATTWTTSTTSAASDSNVFADNHLNTKAVIWGVSFTVIAVFFFILAVLLVRMCKRRQALFEGFKPVPVDFSDYPGSTVQSMYKPTHTKGEYSQWINSGEELLEWRNTRLHSTTRDRLAPWSPGDNVPFIERTDTHASLSVGNGDPSPSNSRPSSHRFSTATVTQALARKLRLWPQRRQRPVPIIGVRQDDSGLRIHCRPGPSNHNYVVVDLPPVYTPP